VEGAGSCRAVVAQRIGVTFRAGNDGVHAENLILWVPKTCATWPDAPLTARPGAGQSVG